ncbi:MAG: 5'/3'-nucleotidase SurE [Chloroflexi bacterium]|nr:5'/3'-nucleotidase SurE [Chloroflexota bacterium]
MTHRRPLILLTNDDGIQAPPLLALHRALREVGELVVIAPEHNWSASGHSKTMHKPLRVSPARLEDGTDALVASGSPSDCVALALLGVLDRRPDLVISGINIGANVSTDLTYSGTVSAAMEAYIAGVSAMAVSLDSHEPYPPEAAARYAARLARILLEHLEEAPWLLNVNVPALPEEEIKGIRVTRLGRRIYRDALVKRNDPRGRTYYWIGGEAPTGIPEEGTDIGALAEGWVSVTPLRLDLTDHERLETLRAWFAAQP